MTDKLATSAANTGQAIPFPERKAEREIERLRKFLARIASADELTGDGPVEPVIENPVGIAAHELRARMRMAQRGLDGEDSP